MHKNLHGDITTSFSLDWNGKHLSKIVTKKVTGSKQNIILSAFEIQMWTLEVDHFTPSNTICRAGPIFLAVKFWPILICKDTDKVNRLALLSQLGETGL